MTIEQLIAQWNASAESAQQQPSSAPLEESAVQVRTGLSAGEWRYFSDGVVYDTETYETRTCTWSTSMTPGCWN